MTVLVVVAACTAVIVAVVIGSLPTGMPDSTGGRSSTLRIAAANLLHSNLRPQEATLRLKRLDADLLVLLEWTGANLDLDGLTNSSLVPILDERHAGTHGVLILVRSPLNAVASLVPNEIQKRCGIPITTIRLGDGTGRLSILGIHAPPPIRNCGGTNAPTMAFLADLIEDGRIARDFGVCRRGDPLILAGDLNVHPWWPTLRTLLERGLNDTYADLHWRPTGTWMGLSWAPKVTRIDYILASRHVAATGAWIIDLPGSDHRAVIADLERNEKEE